MNKIYTRKTRLDEYRLKQAISKAEDVQDLLDVHDDIVGRTSEATETQAEYSEMFECGGKAGDRDRYLGDTCVVTGGPPGLYSMPVYTREELTIVCDALVEPLAKAIHGLWMPKSYGSCLQAQLLKSKGSVWEVCFKTFVPRLSL